VNKFIVLASLGVCLLGAGCGGGKPSLERHQKLVAALNEASDIMAGVTDEASTKDARGKLDDVGKRIRELYREQRLSKDTAMDLENLKYDKKFAKEEEEVTAARDRYGKESARVLADVPASGAILVRTMSGYIYPSTAR